MPNAQVTYDNRTVTVGEGRRFVAPWSATTPPALPANTVPINGAWPAGWTELGSSTKGVDLNFSRVIKKLYIDEQTSPVATPTTSTELTFDLELTEDTLDTMRIAYGGGKIVTVAGTGGANGTRQLIVSPVCDFLAFGFEAQHPLTGSWRRVLVPKVISTAKCKTTYSLNDKLRAYQTMFESLVEISQVTWIEDAGS